MKKTSFGLIVLWMLVCSVNSATASVSIGIGLPNLSIGINLPMYPELAPVPGYPVYYAPGVNGNYFFYDGMYWVYQNDNWYASSWYNGPWGFVEPTAVPMYILRVPVSYYRQPPMYFRGWRSNAPPRWGEHWGRGWEQQRRGWDRPNRKAVPARAPLPSYQRQYTGDRYPARVEQQHELRNQSYRYQPRDKVIRQHFQQQPGQNAPVQRGKQAAPPVNTQRPQDTDRAMPPQQAAPAAARPQQQQQPQRGQEMHEQRQLPGAPQHEQQAPRAQGQEQRQQQERGGQQEHNRGRGDGQDNKDDDRGRGRN